MPGETQTRAPAARPPSASRARGSNVSIPPPGEVEALARVLKDLQAVADQGELPLQVQLIGNQFALDRLASEQAHELELREWDREDRAALRVHELQLRDEDRVDEQSRRVHQLQLRDRDRADEALRQAHALESQKSAQSHSVIMRLVGHVVPAAIVGLGVIVGVSSDMIPEPTVLQLLLGLGATGAVGASSGAVVWAISGRGRRPASPSPDPDRAGDAGPVTPPPAPATPG